MQDLIKVIKEQYDCFGLSHAFILNEDAEKELRNHESDYLNWDSHKLNLYIGNQSLIQYHPDYVAKITKDHIFWKTYWENFGKKIAMDELKIRFNFLNNLEELDPTKKREIEEYGEYQSLNEKILNEKEYSEFQLVKFFEKFCLNLGIFHDINSSFYAREISTKGDYSKSDPWSSE